MSNGQASRCKEKGSYVSDNIRNTEGHGKYYPWENELGTRIPQEGHVKTLKYRNVGLIGGGVGCVFVKRGNGLKNRRLTDAEKKSCFSDPN